MITATKDPRVKFVSPIESVEQPAQPLLRWDKTVTWDSSTMTLRVIRDYLKHDLATGRR